MVFAADNYFTNLDMISRLWSELGMRYLGTLKPKARNEKTKAKLAESDDAAPFAKLPPTVEKALPRGFSQRAEITVEYENGTPPPHGHCGLLEGHIVCHDLAHCFPGQRHGCAQSLPQAEGPQR